MNSTDLMISLLIANLLASVCSTWILVKRISHSDEKVKACSDLDDNEAYFKEIIERQQKRDAFEKEVRDDPERLAAMQEMGVYIDDARAKSKAGK